MASLMIHLIIADKYCKRNSKVDSFEFIHGSIAPDILNNKRSSHYVEDIDTPNTYTEAVAGGVGLVKFCKVNAMLGDYVKGYFMHLLTDYIFYEQYLTKLKKYKLIENGDYYYVKNIMYDEFDRLNDYLTQKYSDIDTEILPPEARKVTKLIPDIIAADEVEKVMDYCASLDLDKLYEKIRNNNLKDINFNLEKF